MAKHLHVTAQASGAVAECFFGALGAGNLDIASELLAPTARWQGLGECDAERSLNGRAQVVAGLTRLLLAGYRTRLLALAAREQSVVACHAEHLGPGTGETIACCRVHVRDGRVVALDRLEGDRAVVRTAVEGRAPIRAVPDLFAGGALAGSGAAAPAPAARPVLLPLAAEPGIY